jgi:ABC-type phosphate transport system ATPase subunit
VEVLKGISIDITKNKVIALVGPSGKEVSKWEYKA